MKIFKITLLILAALIVATAIAGVEWYFQVSPLIALIPNLILGALMGIFVVFKSADILGL